MSKFSFFDLWFLPTFSWVSEVEGRVFTPASWLPDFQASSLELLDEACDLCLAGRPFFRKDYHSHLTPTQLPRSLPARRTATQGSLWSGDCGGISRIARTLTVRLLSSHDTLSRPGTKAER